MILRRNLAALVGSLVLLTAAQAQAQPSQSSLVGPVDVSPSAAPARPNLPNFTMPAGDLRQVGEPRRNGLIAAYPVGRNLQIGIGRFAVPEIARPRTHMEGERHPTAVRSRERGIAAIGLSYSFR
jgi:hypothetical protein